MGWRIRRQWFFIQQRIFYVFSFLLPDNRFGGKCRAALLRWNGAKIGAECFVRGDLRIQESFNLTLGDWVFVNSGCCFDLAAPITIGAGAQLAYQVMLVTGDHEFGPPHNRAGLHCAKPIEIGAGAWIGARAILLPGVKIGDGSVVAAGAVVTKDVPPNVLAAGVPARVLRELPADADAEQRKQAAAV